MPGYLVLEDGTAFEGLWSGGSTRAGEVVFNTSHSGYEEIATDPSYFSQIVVMTAPMQGNYGVDKGVWESRQIYVRGFVCLQLRRGEGSLWKKRLKDFDVPSLEEVDTRSLTLKLREQGTPWGALVEAGSLESARAIAWQKIQEQKSLAPDWVFACTRKAMEKRRGLRPDGPHIAVLDFGTKENILRELEKRSREVSIFPSRASVHEILQVQPEALLLSNGPGDLAS
ncbi:MAG: carbamoyl-phosphate synthase domain-containing protein, partial [Bdellovibrio sp.]